MTDTLIKPVFLEAHLKASTGAKRELVGLAVPYGEETDRRDWFRGTRFMRIDKAEVADGAQLFGLIDVAGGSTSDDISAEAASADGYAQRAMHAVGGSFADE